MMTKYSVPSAGRGPEHAHVAKTHAAAPLPSLWAICGRSAHGCLLAALRVCGRLPALPEARGPSAGGSDGSRIALCPPLVVREGNPCLRRRRTELTRCRKRRLFAADVATPDHSIASSACVRCTLLVFGNVALVGLFTPLSSKWCAVHRLWNWWSEKALPNSRKV